MTSFRLPTGGLVDRNTTLRFQFDAKSFTGHAGDSLASALLANGVSLMGRSFKYHRPRGAVTGGSAEPNALVELRTGARREPNTRATMVELFEGLEAKSQNRWPSLEFDVGAINQLASPLLVAGFYYKTFMWPKAFWEKIYEPLIRRAAGLGSAVHAPDPDSYEKIYGHCDLLVIGGGAAGLMAALTAGRAGARVMIADEHARLGGALLGENETINGKPSIQWVQEALAELASMKEVTILPRTTVFGWFDGNIYGALERVNDHVATPPEYEPRQRYWRIAAKAAILATGAEERPLVFGNNDRPGVMQASAMRGLANRYGVAAGKSVVVFTNNHSGYATARDLTAAGVNVAALIDSRANAPKLNAGKVPVLKGAVVSDVEGSRNVKSVRVVNADGGVEEIACDAVAMSGGFSPVVHLSCHRGLKPVWNEKLAAFLPPDTGKELMAAGAAAGNMTLAAALADGAEKAAKLLTALGFKPKITKPPQADGEPYAVSPLWSVQSQHKAFVDFQNDVTAKDLPLAAREGYKDVELAKRYTTLGMATDQGKLSNVNGIALLAGATGKSIAQVGTTTFRPNYTPVSFGAFAGPFTGHHFNPVRKTPMHAWAEEQGAVFVEAGLWYRPQWFPRAGESGWLESVTREVLATRNSVGVCDVSTLGKIDIQGPDAGEFLNRVYCNGWSTLEVGKARYGLMLREDGVVFDDGTTSRLGPDHFFMTTTTANAARVLTHLEFCHQALWPELDVQYVSVTEQWGQMAIAGPKARATLQKLVDGITLNDETFPYMAARPVQIMGGIPARLFRISFSGEHAYELSVPADYADAVIRAVMHAGAEFNITPYGTEALSVMRIEKGHVAGGELNGNTTAADLGLGRMMSTKKDYIGRMMATREGMTRADREVFVGIRPIGQGQKLSAGAHILNVGDKVSLEADQGYITAVAYSPMLESWIGLALVQRGNKRHGEKVRVFDGLRGQHYDAELCDPVHFDPENRRLHV